jgi:subtilisin family serine protease
LKADAWLAFVEKMMRPLLAMLLVALMLAPAGGAVNVSTGLEAEGFTRIGDGPQLIPDGHSLDVPQRIQSPYQHSSAEPALPWWQTTSMDEDRNRIQDSLQNVVGMVNVGLSYDHTPTDADVTVLEEMGHSVNLRLNHVDALLIGSVDASQIESFSLIEGVVMVERYGSVQFYGDIQTPAVKASNSTEYPVGAWNLGVSGKGVNIALTDTGVDSEHPGLVGKHVAGYDAVCFVHSDPTCILAGGRETDGSFDPDDGNQHGTACMGMAAASGIGPGGEQTDYYGAAPNASLVDVRIGTDVGAGPFENYVLEQEFYESAMNGIQWIIDNRDTAWAGVDESLHGIDIISLSWGITSHEGGGSDGEDMHSRILNEATLAGVVVSVAAGNDGPNNDGLSGMGSSSLSITVGATDDMNTVGRSDDEIAGYSSRGPRRDNGDNNPINELKPDLSAPGTNIIQAEGCVTSGSCNNNVPGQDASGNTYTGRGSGTSYATPAVTGIIALMLEANPELDPLQVREILRVTAEPRGTPTSPDIDPVWNRDFGWGMVDAYEAVKMAFFLNESGTDLGSLNLDIQMRSNMIQQNGSVHRADGIAWARSGSVDSVQYRIDEGSWKEATYEIDEGGTTALVPVNWSVSLDVDMLSAGNHSVEVKAVGGNGSSLPISYMVQGSGKGLVASEEGSGRLLFLGGLLLLVLAAGGYASWKQSKDNSDSSFTPEVVAEITSSEEVPLEAELVENESAST